MKNIFITFCFIQFAFLHAQKDKINLLKKFPISFVDSVHADFSFKDTWRYPFGVYKRDDGVLRCDGFCAPELERFYDTTREIMPQFVDSYYFYVDTSHIPLNNKIIDAWTFGWAGSAFMNYNKKQDTIELNTMGGAGGYGGFRFVLIKDSLISYSKFNSPQHSVKEKHKSVFECTQIKLTMDRGLYANNIIKCHIKADYNDGLTQEEKIKAGRNYPPIHFEGLIYLDLKKKVYFWSTDRAYNLMNQK